MACAGCPEGLSQVKIRDNEIIKSAKKKAIEEGIGYALYRNEYGEISIIRASEAAGYPVIGFVTHLQGS